MIENALSRKGYSSKAKITIKSFVSVALTALAVALPMLVHAVGGSEGGVKWLPMYLPVILGAALLGMKWGVTVAIASPIVSFCITSLCGNAMPGAARLPFMLIELVTLALVMSMFSKRAEKNVLAFFLAVIIAFVCSRAVLLSLSFISGSEIFTPSMILSQIKSGLIGVIAQTVVAPIVLIVTKFALDREKKYGGE